MSNHVHGAQRSGPEQHIRARDGFHGEFRKSVLANSPERSPIRSNPECRRLVEHLIWLDIWVPRLILVACLTPGSIGFFCTLMDGRIPTASLALDILGGAIVAWIINWFVRSRIIRPRLAVAFTGVADRLRARVTGHAIRDWRGWAHETPGIAALVESDQLFLCDRSTGYEELLLSSGQIGAATVELEQVAQRISIGQQLGLAGAHGALPLSLSGGSHGSTTEHEERVFLKILYFVRCDTPVRSTRIPFGVACRDAQGWVAEIERVKRHAKSAL